MVEHQSLSPDVLLAEKIKKIFLTEPHRAYTAHDLLKALKLTSPKDQEKEARTLCQIEESLTFYREEGRIREVGPSLFKTRLFFDPEKHIEQAFIGGMGNPKYSFNAQVFRFNIGVLSLYFLKNEKEHSWRVDVSDTTIGRDYSLVCPLHAGMHRFGTNPKKEGEETIWSIEGKYINPTHLTAFLSHEKIDVEDHRTLRGTRIDHLTDSGFARYAEAAEQFLKSVSMADQNNVVRRGRFVMEQMLCCHKNFEASFFSKVVDYLLIQKS